MEIKKRPFSGGTDQGQDNKVIEVKHNSFAQQCQSLMSYLHKRLEQHIVCLAYSGITSTSWAGWLIGKMGVAHD